MGTTSTTRHGMRVAELAGRVGVSPDTIRFYEREGLLPAPRRTPSGYRSYDIGAVDRLLFIQGAQRLGLRLTDIRDLLAVRDTGTCPCEPAEQLLRRRLAELDAQNAAGRLARRDGRDDRRATSRSRLPWPGARDVVPAQTGEGVTNRDQVRLVLLLRR